jgi:hypothetical protein
VREGGEGSLVDSVVVPRGLLVVASVALGVLAVGCSGGGGRSPRAFCTELEKDHTAITTPIASEDGITVVKARYEAVDRVAPEAIRDDWHKITMLVEQAAELDPSKPDEQAKLTEAAYAASGSAAAVSAYAKATCTVDLPVPVPTAPSTTTTTAKGSSRTTTK